MQHFLHTIIEPTAVLLLFVFLYAISTQAYPAFRARTASETPAIWIWPILWIILAIVAFIAWCFIVFG